VTNFALAGKGIVASPYDDISESPQRHQRAPAALSKRCMRDLCDVLSAFSPQNKATLYELCRVLGLPGKPDSMGGAEVERYYREGRVAEIAAYCETDVVNTYRVWLRYEFFRGRLSEKGLLASEANLAGMRS
jgi:predicted PolB exonuclease-like 3'-5' exonuclease